LAGQRPDQEELSCWGWYVGMPSNKFTFGAHDFRGGSFETGLEESVSSANVNVFDVSDGEMHNVAGKLGLTGLLVAFFVVSRLHSDARTSDEREALTQLKPNNNKNLHAALTHLFGSRGGHRKQHLVLFHRCGAPRHGKGRGT
jgi:hypothetical protein